MNKWTRVVFVILGIIALLVVLGMAGWLWAVTQSIKPRPHPTVVMNHPLADKSFITGEPCQAPCWYGLRIGESTYDEALQILEDLPFVVVSSIHERGGVNLNEKQILFECVYLEHQSCGIITSSENILTWMSFTVSYNLTIREVFDLLGDPKYVFLGELTGSDRCEVGLSWPNQLVFMTYYEPDGIVCQRLSQNPKNLDQSIQVERIIYMVRNAFGVCKKGSESCSVWNEFSDP